MPDYFNHKNNRLWRCHIHIVNNTDKNSVFIEFSVLIIPTLYERADSK